MYSGTSNNTTFSVTLDGEANGALVDMRLRQRCFLKFSKSTAALYAFGVVFIDGGLITDEVRYYTAPDGIGEISIRDILRKIKVLGHSGVTLHVYSYANYTDVSPDDTFTVTLNLYEGIAYNNLNAPRGKDIDYAAAMSPSVILPPNVMINPNTYFTGGGPGILVESNVTDLSVNLMWTDCSYSNHQLGVTGSTRSFSLWDGKTLIKEYKLLEMPDCADLACIQWLSLTGVVRRHFFPIVSFIRGNGDEVALDSIGDGYEVLKENYTAFRCSLSGLTAWGYYYYMDMIQSSDIHAFVCRRAIDGEFTNIVKPYTAVYVKQESMETPTGPGFFTFEFVVNIKQYRI